MYTQGWASGCKASRTKAIYTLTPTSQYVHKQLPARKVISCSRIVYLTEQGTVNSPLTDRSFFFFFFFFFRLGEIFIIDNPDILFEIF